MWFRVRVGVLAVVLLTAFISAAPAAVKCDAAAFVESGANEMLKAARAHSAPALANVVDRYGDVRGMALYALGPYRNRLTKAKEAEYFALTRTFIGQFLAKYSRQFEANSFTIQSCTGKPSALTVVLRLSTGSKVILRLAKGARGYYARDMNIASIWLASQMKASFTDVLARNKGAISALFAFLRR